MATALTVLLVSCSGAPGGTTLPPPPSTVRVRMVGYRFLYQAPTLPGRAVFSVSNADKVDHQLTLVPLDNDVPPIDNQLHGRNRRNANPEAQTPIVHPGQAEAFAIDLQPGRRYALICFLRDPGDSVIHALKGMNSEFRAGH